MSMYNLIHQVHPLAGALMTVLGLEPPECGRFRDCYLVRGGDAASEIHVFTRNGGGNRLDHEEATARLRARPTFLRDFDDEYDNTYASYVFGVPEEWAGQVDMLVMARPDAYANPSFRERSEEALGRLRDDPDSPEARRVLAAIKPVFDQVNEALETGEPKIVKV